MKKRLLKEKKFLFTGRKTVQNKLFGSLDLMRSLCSFKKDGRSAWLHVKCSINKS